MQVNISTLISAKKEAGTLIWSDEFDYTGSPNPAKWGYDVEGYLRNSELQCFTSRPDNVYVDNGTLKIKLLKDNYVSPQSGVTYPYTSSSIMTYQKFHFTRGRIEVKAKVPSGPGTWVSIWTLGARFGQPNTSNGGLSDISKFINWPLSGEMDLVEHTGNDNSNFHFSNHTEKYYWVNGNQKTATATSSDPNGWHVYAIELFDHRIDYYFDGVKKLTYTNERIGQTQWPYDLPQYLILNLAYGGLNGGSINDAQLPQILEIDYVRIFA